MITIYFLSASEPRIVHFLSDVFQFSHTIESYIGNVDQHCTLHHSGCLHFHTNQITSIRTVAPRKAYRDITIRPTQMEMSQWPLSPLREWAGPMGCSKQDLTTLYILLMVHPEPVANLIIHLCPKVLLSYHRLCCTLDPGLHYRQTGSGVSVLYLSENPRQGKAETHFTEFHCYVLQLFYHQLKLSIR